MSDRLAEIMAHKRREIADRLRPVPDDQLARFAGDGRPSFYEALAKPDRLSVIAEIKRRSPSAGAIAEGVAADEQARRYHNAGADALSVLTDEKYFGGTLEDLWSVTDLLKGREDAQPCLRKDFFVDPMQVLEAAEAGASAILIIVRALEDEEIATLYAAAQTAGLDALFEIHEERELERALKHKPRIIGVNNRDLTRFVTDLAYSEQLIPQIPDDIISISESGIFNADDASRARACGADAILVGEALMKAEDPEALVADFHEA